jgi:hypothetical protein
VNNPQLRFPGRNRIGASENLIQNGTVQRRIADRYQLKESSPVPTLAPEIQAVTIVDDLTIYDREDTGVIASIGLSHAGTVGQLGKFEVFNPLLSDVLVRLKRVLLSCSDNAKVAHFECGLRLGSLGSTLSAPAWNTRQPASTVPPFFVAGGAVGGVFSQVGASTVAQMVRFWLQPFTSTIDLDVSGVVLVPGMAFVVQNLTAFMDADCTLEWFEESLRR